MSPETVNAVGRGLDVPANGLRYIGNTVSQGVDDFTGTPNSLQIAGTTVSNFLDSIGLNDDFLTGLGAIAGGLGGVAALEGGAVRGALGGGRITDATGPDFYVKPDGTAVPSKGHRAVGENALTRAENGDIMSQTGDTYFTFDDITGMSGQDVKNFLQLPRAPSHVATFDTLPIIDDIKVPNGNWNTNGVPEPITSTMPHWGTGGATQATTNTPIKDFDLKPLP